MSQPMTPTPTPKKKMSPWAWVAIGCGAIAVLAILAIGGTVAAGGWFLKKQVNKYEANPAVAAAELLIRANPDVELVESDVEKGTITFRNKADGEVITMNAQDIQDGKFSVTTKEGTTTIDGSTNGEEGGTLTVTNDKGEQAVFNAGTEAPKNLPSWLPAYAGGTVEGAYDATTAEGRNAMFTMKTSDNIDQVAEFYESKLKAAGLKVDRASYETNGEKAITLSGTSEDNKQTASVVVNNADGMTQAVINFAEKK